MVKVDVAGVSLYLDGYIKENLDFLREKVEHKWDGVSLWVGEEGDGKTTAALQSAFYLDPSLCLERIVFNARQFEEAVNTAQPFQSIVWDEADDLAGHWASKMVRTIKRLMKRIRKKQLYIFLVTPSLFDLGKYFVIHRAKFFVHVYSKGLERGFLRFFTGEKKTLLYMSGYKMWNMYAINPNFVASFTDLPKGFPIDMKLYEIKKDAATANGDEDDLSPGRENKMERVCYGLKLRGWSVMEISDLTGYSDRRVREFVQSGRFKGLFTGHVGGLGRMAAENTTPNLTSLSLKKEEGEVD